MLAIPVPLGRFCDGNLVTPLYSSVLLISDSPKIWRLYVVYGKRFWVVIPPLLLVTGYTGMVFSLGLRVFGITFNIPYRTS